MRQHPVRSPSLQMSLQVQPRLLLRAQSAASLAPVYPYSNVLLSMSSPIIPWMGGKRRLADRLIPLFPPHECYVEVFASGAALYFMRPQAAPVEVLNDINGDLVTLYRVVQNHLEEFVRQFKWALSSRQVFEWQKMTRPETLTDIQRAARFFLSAAPCLRREGQRTDLWYCHHWPCHQPAADRGEPLGRMAATVRHLRRKSPLA